MRSQPLDILRAFAVFLVLGRHMAPCPAEVNLPLHFVTAFWQRGGWVGVDLFFVLSGFLVSGLLFKEHLRTGKVVVGRFLIRRGFKIYPSFYVLILATVILIHNKVTLPKLLAEIFFVQNYFPRLWGHTWSLAVEEHFYLLLTFTIRFLPRLQSSIPVLWAIVALTCLALRIYTARTHIYSAEAYLFPTHLRLDSLGFGVLLSYFKYFRPKVFTCLQRRWLIAPGLLALLPPFFFLLNATPFIYTAGFSIFYLGGGMVLMSVIGTEGLPGILGRLVAFIGARSYSIYLWHIPVSLVALRISNWYIYAVVYLIAALAVGVGMNLILEAPLLKIRDYLFPSFPGRASPTG